jgi:hypothetical protein
MLIKKCLAKVFQPLIGAINDSRDSLVAENQKLRLEMLGILGTLSQWQEMLGERFQETCAHYRDYGSGWVMFGRTASGKGYTVHGIVRRTSHLLRWRIEHLRRDEKIYGRRLFLHYCDLSDSSTLSRIIAELAVYAPLSR